MTIRLRVHVLQIAIACVLGLLFGWVQIARGDEVPHLVLDMPAEVVTATPCREAPVEDWATFSMRFAITCGLIGAAVRAARGTWVEVLAPVPSTPLSRTLVFGVACLAGTVLAVVEVGPSLGHGTLGRIVGGVFAACLTYVGAGITPAKLRGDTVGKLGRVHREAITREQAKAAGLTTGQMRVLAIGEETPGPGTPPPEV